MVVIVVNQYNRESSCHNHDLLINPFLSHRFIDGTFKVVRKPFVQLLTVNAFVKKGEAIKQLAFLYIIMSRRKKKDYVAVSCRVMEVLGYIKTFKLFPSTPEIALDREPVTGLQTPSTVTKPLGFFGREMLYVAICKYRQLSPFACSDELHPHFISIKGFKLLGITYRL